MESTLRKIIEKRDAASLAVFTDKMKPLLYSSSQKVGESFRLIVDSKDPKLVESFLRHLPFSSVKELRLESIDNLYKIGQIPEDSPEVLSHFLNQLWDFEDHRQHPDDVKNFWWKNPDHQQTCALYTQYRKCVSFISNQKKTNLEQAKAAFSELSSWLSQSDQNQLLAPRVFLNIFDFVSFRNNLSEALIPVLPQLMRHLLEKWTPSLFSTQPALLVGILNTSDSNPDIFLLVLDYLNRLLLENPRADIVFNYLQTKISFLHLPDFLNPLKSIKEKGLLNNLQATHIHKLLERGFQFFGDPGYLGADHFSSSNILPSLVKELLPHQKKLVSDWVREKEAESPDATQTIFLQGLKAALSEQLPATNGGSGGSPASGDRKKDYKG
jgi:hypothetical protein